MKKILLDTNILLTDPDALFKFKNNNVIISTLVLQELDNIKDRKEKAGVNFEARMAIRSINETLSNSNSEQMLEGVAIKYPDGMKDHGGKLTILPHKTSEISKIVDSFGGQHSPDEYLIASAIHLQQSEPESEIILVTQDVNMRIIANAFGVKHVQAYRNEKALDDLDMLTECKQIITNDDAQAIYTGCEPDENGKMVLSINAELLNRPYIGLTVIGQTTAEDIYLIGEVCEITEKVIKVRLKDAKEVINKKAWGIKGRTIEQSLALDALLDNNIPAVVLFGGAGTGKTLLALSSAIELVLNDKSFDKIICVRSLTDLDEKIGFLSGSETEKVLPWLGGLTDSLEFLTKNDEKGINKGMKSDSAVEILAEKANIQPKALNFFRGKSLNDCILIVDEGQDLSKHQIKTIISRVGPNSRVFILGNLSQIDSMVSVHTSGLTHLITKAKSKGNSLVKAIYLKSIERSPLAKFAEEEL